MKRILWFLAQVIGSIMFSLLGGTLLVRVALAVVEGTANGPGSGPHFSALIGLIVLGGLGFILGTTVGAAAGATVVRRISRRRGSFWKALLGSAAGLLAGGTVVYAMCALGVGGKVESWVTAIASISSLMGMRVESWVIAIASISSLMAMGAVIGSGWKAKPRDAESPPG